MPAACHCVRNPTACKQLITHGNAHPLRVSLSSRDDTTKKKIELMQVLQVCAPNQFDAFQSVNAARHSDPCDRIERRGACARRWREILRRTSRVARQTPLVSFYLCSSRELRSPPKTERTKKWTKLNSPIAPRCIEDKTIHLKQNPLSTHNLETQLDQHNMPAANNLTNGPQQL